MADAWGASWGASSAWGTSWLAGAAPQTGATGGDRIVGGTFTRKKWREFKEAEAAKRALEEKALELNSDKPRKKIISAVRVVEEAIDLASMEEAANLAKLTAALEAAVGAKRIADTIKQAETAKRYAKAIIEEIEDEEDSIALLLMH